VLFKEALLRDPSSLQDNLARIYDQSQVMLYLGIN